MLESLRKLCKYCSAFSVSFALGACAEQEAPAQHEFDVPTSADSAGDSAQDSGGGFQRWAECETDFDCAAIPGKTACKHPACDKALKKCKVAQRPLGAACVAYPAQGGDCETSACDAAGECTATPKPAGSHCGTSPCGHKCDGVGLCVDATVGDYTDNNPCTSDFCNQGFAVEHLPITTPGACDDGNPCTTNDHCSDGKCAGTAKDCP